MPRLPGEWRKILVQLGLDYSQIETLLDAENEFRGKVNILEMIESVIDDVKKAKFIANWNVNNLIPMLRESEMAIKSIDYNSIELAIYELSNDNKLSSTNAKLLFRDLVVMDKLPDIESYANEKGYIQVSDESSIAKIVDEVLADASSTKAVADLKNGNDKVIGFLVGQVMKKSGGKANPALAQKLIRERIS
jgi:aspartyl-tRNA(Asn)/glutamyl-tRNA(Gln) amidotransferase subunit B